MEQPLIISISGVRGVIGASLGPGEACRFGLAYGAFLRARGPEGTRPRVALGRDSRPSGDMLTAALAAGLMATGCDTVELGIVSTPGAALMVRHLACDGGVVITASHNPTEYNGIKFLRHDGIAYPADEVKQIHARYHGDDYRVEPATSTGQRSVNHETHAIHVAAVLGIVDADAIRARHFKVVLDSINGAGCVGSRLLLEKLGCELVHLNDQPNGLFAHRPEPTAENLAGLGPEVARADAAVGFAQDPDADRLAVVDEQGRYIGEEYTLALAVKYVLAHRPGKVAINLSTSRMTEDLAAAGPGSEVIRTPVGEAHVANSMVANACVIGGEGNGGVIDLRVVPVRDSFVAMALVLALLAETGKTVSELVAEIPRYEMVKTKYPCPQGQAGAALERLRAHYEQAPDARVDTRDGIRVDLPAGWVQLRASNTEPIVRLIAESPDAAATARLIDEARAAAGL